LTRASSGTYVDSTGTIKTATTNEARFDHGPTTGESLGLLVEEQRTNLFLNTEVLASWGAGTRSTVSSNTSTAPDGTTTADTLVEDNTASNTHEILNTAGVAFVSGTTYTFTVFAKAKERSQINLFLPGAAFGSGTAQEIRFDLQAATTAVVTGSPTAVITTLANGWYRCSVTAAATTTTTGYPRFRLSVGGTTSYTGDGTSGIYLWGAQLEAGAFPTSYIPTTTATVTRSADVASITGANFSSWYNALTGTLFTDVSIGYTVPGTQFPLVGSFNDGTSNNRVENGFLTSAVAGFEVTTGGVSQVQSYPATSALSRKLAGAYSANDFAASVNGGGAATDNSGSLPVVDRLFIGSRTGGGGVNSLNGAIRRLCFWPQRLSNSTLQTLTQ
jgi:hypothetical protein